MGFNLIYWNPMTGSYFLYGTILEKCGNFRKNGRFSGRIWPDWGNTTWADMAGLGSIGLIICNHILDDSFGSIYFGLALTTTSDVLKGTTKNFVK